MFEKMYNAIGGKNAVWYYRYTFFSTKKIEESNIKIFYR